MGSRYKKEFFHILVVGGRNMKYQKYGGGLMYLCEIGYWSLLKWYVCFKNFFSVQKIDKMHETRLRNLEIHISLEPSGSSELCSTSYMHRELSFRCQNRSYSIPILSKFT